MSSSTSTRLPARASSRALARERVARVQARGPFEQREGFAAIALGSRRSRPARASRRRLRGRGPARARTRGRRVQDRRSATRCCPPPDRARRSAGSSRAASSGARRPAAAAVVQMRAALWICSWLSQGSANVGRQQQRHRDTGEPGRRSRRPAGAPAGPWLLAASRMTAICSLRRCGRRGAARVRAEREPAHRRCRAGQTPARRGLRTPRTSRTSRARPSRQIPRAPLPPPRRPAGRRALRVRGLTRANAASSAAPRPTTREQGPHQPGLHERAQLDAVRVVGGSLRCGRARGTAAGSCRRRFRAAGGRRIRRGPRGRSRSGCFPARSSAGCPAELFAA